MGKLIWILLIGFCLIAVHAKKEETAAESGNSSDEADAAAAEEDNSDEEKEESNPGEEASKEEAKASPEENGDAAKSESESESKEDEAPSEDGDANAADSEASEEEEGEGAEAAPASTSAANKSPEFQCNLKFNRVGCYADKSKKEKPLRSFIMTDADLGPTSKKGKLPNGDKFNTELPKFACKCANEAINNGNAIFGIQNIAECWTGPDDSKYDKDGESNECVTFNYAQCEGNSLMCAGKKHANFVYYVDTPEHTKPKEQIQREYAEYQKKVAAHEKKKALNLKKKAAKKLKKAKSKKSKKE